MARALWSGTLQFGLVCIPVKLYPAVKEEAVHFHQLHAGCGSRINLKRVCAREQVEVPYENIVKGFEVAAGQYVVLGDEELKALAPQRGNEIRIADFVPFAEIDAIYFDKTYYLAPDKGGQRAYALLVAALKKSGQVGIAHVTLRAPKTSLCCVRVIGSLLAVTTLNYESEVLPRAEFEQGMTTLPAANEVEMAEQLITALGGHFEPGKYQDEQREKVLALIERKKAGEVLVAAANEPMAKAVDLVSALAASLAAVEQKPTPPTAPAQGKAKKSKKAA